MARPRKILSVKALADAWEAFKLTCDTNTKTVVKHVDYEDADNNNSSTSTTEVSAPITYTIVGFCVYLGINKSNWYETYEPDPRYRDINATIHAEYEADVRKKFETGEINSRLAPLWMSKYGYGAKVETTNEHKADNNLMDAIKTSLDALGGDT